MNEKVYKQIRNLAKFTAIAGLRVYGLEYVLENPGAKIIAPNHDNWKDVILIALALQESLNYIATDQLKGVDKCEDMILKNFKRPTSRLVKLLSHFVSKSIIVPGIKKLDNTIYVRLHDESITGLKALIKESIKKLQDEEPLLIFPEQEGTEITRKKEGKMIMRPGVYVLASSYYHTTGKDIPIIPTGIINSRKLIGNMSGYEVRFGPPLHIKTYLKDGKNKKQNKEEFLDDLKERILDLL